MNNYYLKILTIIFLITVRITAYSQAGQTAFELEKMNILYRGLENPLKIVSNSKIDSIIISSIKTYEYNYAANGEIKDSSLVEIKSDIIKVEKSNTYTVKPGNTNVCELIVYSNGQAIDSRSFRVKPLPVPIIKVGTKKSGESIKVSELPSLPLLRCVIEGFDFDVTWKVLSFEVSKKTKDKFYSRSVNGSDISSDLRDWLMDTKPNDIIYFEDIRVKGPDGYVIKASSVKLTISK